ncbi:hypothetical protein ACG33_14455 [Steroidobacter denitrificans]|uniref:Uncharacterized protein n=1 Tax=Steroidobacter denitrificans TaxID=465721 RepID=A0A127FEI5_STEDE|nr:hypothetical protein ACG33_14455 [Steroidobacter denitrificans]
MALVCRESAGTADQGHERDFQAVQGSNPFKEQDAPAEGSKSGLATYWLIHRRTAASLKILVRRACGFTADENLERGPQPTWKRADRYGAAFGRLLRL